MKFNLKFNSKYNTIILIILIIFLFILFYSNFVFENMDTYTMKNLLVNTGNGSGRLYELDTNGNFSEKDLGVSLMSSTEISTNTITTTTSPNIITNAPSPQITTVPIMTTTPVITATPTKPFNPNMVTVYTDKDYNGIYAQLGIGNYTMNDLLLNGIPDKSIQSVHVPSGRILVLFQDDYYQGNSLYVTNDENTFNTSINRFSSLKIR